MERSESITALAKAMVEFNQKMVRVLKDSVNPHFKNRYASLSAIIEATSKPLSECGLVVIQLPCDNDRLTTLLLHCSGEYISETYTMKPQKNDPQGQGSALTYQRRYALGAILNLNIEEDDDGHMASQSNGVKQPQSQESKGDRPQPDKPWLNEKQLAGVLERIKAGDKEVYQKTVSAYLMKKEYRQKLDEAAGRKG